MKSILLATAASVAFAGAAAAEVTFSGSAAASYNNNEGYAWETKLKASMSQELNNGLTVTGSVSFETADGADADTYTAGAISVASETASISFGSGMQNGVYKAISDSYGMGGSEDGFTGIVASYSMGETTVYADVQLDADDTAVTAADVALAAKTTVSGFTVSAAYKDGKFAAKASGAVAGATVSAGFGNGDGTNDWDIKASYPVGPVTVSAAYDETQKYVLGASYAANGVTVAAEYKQDGGAWSVDASYDYGSGIKVLAGLADKGKDMYIGATYDLGGGASLLASYGKDADGSAANEIGAPDYKKGATVKVSFAF